MEEKKPSLVRRGAIHGFANPSPFIISKEFLATVELTRDVLHRSHYRPVFNRELPADKKTSAASEEELTEEEAARTSHSQHPSGTSTYVSSGVTAGVSQELPQPPFPEFPASNRPRRRSEASTTDSRVKAVHRARAYTELVGENPFESNDSKPPSPAPPGLGLDQTLEEQFPGFEFLELLFGDPSAPKRRSPTPPGDSGPKDRAFYRARAYTDLTGRSPDSDPSSPAQSETRLDQDSGSQDQNPTVQRSIFRDLLASPGLSRLRPRRTEADLASANLSSQSRNKPPTPRGLPPPARFPENTERASSDPKHSVKLREDYTPSHLRIGQPKFFRATPTESQARLQDALEHAYNPKVPRRPVFLGSPEPGIAPAGSPPDQYSQTQDIPSPCPRSKPRGYTCAASHRFPGSENLPPPRPPRAPELSPLPKFGDSAKTNQGNSEQLGFPQRSSKEKSKKKVAPSPVFAGFPQPYTFETSDKRRFDPLNFVPFASENSGYNVEPESSQLVPEANSRATPAGKTPTFDDILKPASHHTSLDSQLSSKGERPKSDPKSHRKSETKEKPKKKKSSFGLGGLKKKLLPQSPKLTTEELKARISLPIGPEPEITPCFYKPVLSPDQPQKQESDQKRDRIPPPEPPTKIQHVKPRQPLPNFEFPSRNMEPSRLLDPSSAVMAITRQKAEAMRLAREQAAAVNGMCRRAKTEAPPYEFEELIGKGAYGRVYKGRSLPNHQLVAIKVLDIDAADYKSVRDLKDESIKDFIHETKVLKQVKDSGARNVNMIIEAISIHSQLWLVCEYCPGGSVKTLMRATNNKLDERFIIPIARELAIGLRAIHDAGIIHRDVKAANVLIHEEGRLQICDFGVAGVLQSKVDKRSTWIGTPHWMPPEMFPNKSEVTQYGSEIDVWAYGCTLFEFATGNPPNATLRERMQIGRQLNRFPPKLEGGDHSDDLRSLVSFSLNTDPRTRPTMQQILDHPYITDSASAYPTASLGDLVRIYYQWAQRGGQRISLFNPGGAAAAEVPGEDSLQREDWNFSTTAGFERRFSIIDLDQLSASLADLEGELTPIQSRQPEVDAFETALDDDMTPEQKANFNERVKRGGEALDGLFNNKKPGYKYETKNDFVPVGQGQRVVTDLPLRTDTDRSSVASTFIDLNLGAFDSSHYAAGSASSHPFQLADADTIRANRSSSRLFRQSSGEHPPSHTSDGGSISSQEAEFQPPGGPRPPTMDWTFPTSMQPAAGEESEVDVDGGIEGGEDEFGGDKRDTREWTFPVMTAEDTGNNGYEQPEEEGAGPRSSLPELQNPSLSNYGGVHNYNLDGPADSRPSTADSAASKVSDPDHDPFRFDRTITTPDLDYMSTVRPGTFADFHTSSTTTTAVETTAPNTLLGSQATSEANTDTGPNTRKNSLETDPLTMKKSPTKPLSNTGSLRRPRVAGTVFQFPEVYPPSTESLSESASDEVVTEEMKRLLGDFINGLAAVGDALTVVDAGKVGGEKAEESPEEQQQQKLDD